MPRRSTVDWRAVSDAAPFGNIRRADLRTLGVADSTIAHRTTSGMWVLALPGLLRLTNGTPTRDQLVDGALLYAGPSAVVSGVAACRLYGLRCGPDDGTVFILMPHESRRSSVGYVEIERTRRMPEARERGDFAVAPIERAVIDAARNLDDLDDVRAVVAEAAQRRFTTPERLSAELEAGSGRGSSRVRVALQEITAGVHSAPEAWAYRIGLELAESGVGPIMWNRTLVTADGRFLAKPDGWIDEVGLAWEINSVEYHSTPADQDRTERRAALMRRHDIELVEHRPRQLQDEPEQVKEDLRLAFTRALRRPRPPVVMR